MDPILIAGMVVVFVQGIKEALKKIKINVNGWMAIVLTVLVSAAEVASQLDPLVLSFSAIWLFVQVVVYALGGYGLVKVASGNGC